MGEFFFFLGLLLQCGIFPTSWDSCRPPREIPPHQQEVTTPRASGVPAEGP